MENCIFCQIVRGKAPDFRVYEDKDFLGFLDTNPQVPGHTLVIPKKHYHWVYEVPDFGRYWEAALKVTKAIQKACHPEFIRYVTYGVHVPHAHIHILPQGGIIKGDLSEIAQKIGQSL